VRARKQSEDLSLGAGWLRWATLNLRALSLKQLLSSGSQELCGTGRYCTYHLFFLDVHL
jgi:hypothetical protein